MLLEIFYDSDSAESADDSDNDAVLYDSRVQYNSRDESQSGASKDEHDSDEEAAQEPPAKKDKGKVEGGAYSATNSPVYRSVRNRSWFAVPVARWAQTTGFLVVLVHDELEILVRETNCYANSTSCG